MSKKGYSQPDAFGGYTHYDGSGKKIGRSEPGFFGEYTHYDANGRRTGHSEPVFLGGYNHYDSRNRRTGRSDPVFFGSYNHYDSRVIEPAAVIPVSSAATTTTKTPAVAMLPLASTDHTIVPKCGLCADSVTTSWPNMLSDVCLSVPITP